MFKFLSRILVVALGLLALNLLAYGGMFVLSPTEGLSEFGLMPSSGLEFLIGLVGIGMLGFTGIAALAIIYLFKREIAGPVISQVLGWTSFAVGAWAFGNHYSVDALIYGGFGLLLCLLSALLLLARPND